VSARGPNIRGLINQIILLVIYGTYGLVQLAKKQQSGGLRLMSYIGLIGVGVCSGGYHMTLKYHTQMCRFSPIALVLPDPWHPLTLKHL
jgi:Alkaline phytoceramidase (aPHC).